MSSIKLLHVGSTYTWEIPVADSDGDVVRCRWASRGPPDECDGFVYIFFFLYLTALVLHSVCNAFPNSSLYEYPCTLTYNATTTGLWAVALKIEDFEFSSSTKPLSGSSIQFIVFVEPSTNSCKTCMKIFDTF
jgi:hypothetical protein